MLAILQQPSHHTPPLMHPTVNLSRAIKDTHLLFRLKPIHPSNPSPSHAPNLAPTYIPRPRHKRHQSYHIIMATGSTTGAPKSPLNKILYYLCLTPSPEKRQRKQRQLRAATERHRIERETRRVEGERRWGGVIDGWLRDASMEEEAGCVGEDVE